MWKKKKDHNQPSSSSTSTEKNGYSNGWHNARNHQWNQIRWGSTHRPHHIIVACFCNRCTRYSPFQGEWNHASWHGISLCQWWTW
jgi:hypothetical protein